MINNYDVLGSLNNLQQWMLLNHKSHKLIYLIGLLFLAAFIIKTITDKFRIPSVVGYILLGTLFSESVVRSLSFLPREFLAWHSYLLNTLNFITVPAEKDQLLHSPRQ